MRAFGRHAPPPGALRAASVRFVENAAPCGLVIAGPRPGVSPGWRTT